MSVSQGRLTVRTDYTWTVPNVKRLTKKNSIIVSPSFNEKRWQVELESKPNRYLNLWLKAVPSALEQARGEWRRIVEYYLVVKTPSGQRLGQSSASKETFSPESAVWGDNDIVEDGWCYNREVILQNELHVEVHIVEHPSEDAMAIREEKLVTSTKRVQALLATFDDPNTSDLAFIFPAPEGQDGKGMKIYAAKKQLMACSTYFKEMFDPLPTNRLPASEPEAAEEQKDDTPEAEMETPAEPTSDQPAEVDATTKEEIELDDGEAADAQPATPTPTPPSAVPMAPYCIDTLHQDSDNEIDERYRSQYKPRPYRAHIRKIVIKDAKYSTYKALLFWLLSGLIEFAPLRSRERAKIFKSTSEDPGANFASVRNIFKNAIEKDEHGLEWTTCPLPCSPKSIYRVATAYGIQDLKTIALDHLLNSLTPQNVTFEIFSPFSARFEAVKEMEIDYLIANWGRVSRSRAWIALLDPKTIQTPQDMATLHQVISRTMARNVPEYKKLEVEDSDEETEDGGDQTQEEEATGAED